MMPVETVVVVGGGLVGVFATLRMRALRPKARIMLVEQDDALGGLLRSDPHPNGLAFDRGTHILSQTGVQAIDTLLFDDLDDVAWRRFGGAERDLAGLLIGDTVLDGSPFLPAPVAMTERQLSRVNTEHLREAVPDQNLYARLVGWHGREMTEEIFRTPVRNLYQAELEDLDVFVASQLPLSRVVSDGLDTWLSRQDDAVYRSLIACPQQRQIPTRFSSPHLALYPNRMGVGQVFEQLTGRLEAARVELRLSTRISGLGRSTTRINALRLTSAAGDETIDGNLVLVWAAPPFQLQKLLDLPTPTSVFRPGWRTIIVDFCANLTRNLGCYYYIDYDDNEGFRLTNYAAMSDEAAARAASPFTFEFWWRGGAIDETAAQNVVTGRFAALGLIADENAISDVRVRSVAQGVPFATTANMQAITDLSELIAKMSPSNIINIGLLSRPGLFFTSDMLRNAETKMIEKLT